MGFWNTLRGHGNSALTGMGDAWKRNVSNADFLPAFASAMGLIVAADGNIDQSEIDGVMDFVNNDDTLKAWKGDVRAKAFEEALEAAQKGIVRQAGLFGKIAKLKGKPEAETLLQLVVALANADGNFDPKERAMFDRICKTLDKDPKNYV